MFSSGTTGPPKAMVHGAGGSLLEHVKEHRLHGDLRPDDMLYFHTTTAWMMWNWQLSALAVRRHVVLYDGPVIGPETLWELVAEHGVTVFGTSPAYLQLCQDAGYRPRATVDLGPLRAVLSTGAVLHDWQFDWVRRGRRAGAAAVDLGRHRHRRLLRARPPRAAGPPRPLPVAAASVSTSPPVDDGRPVVVGRSASWCAAVPFPSRPVGFLRDPTAPASTTRTSPTTRACGPTAT